MLLTVIEMRLRPAVAEEFEAVRDFYWELIDLMKDRTDSVGWKKGIYPTDRFLRESIEKKELFVLDGGNGFTACVVLNSRWNEGYEGVSWSVDCPDREVLVPHALAVRSSEQGRGIGKEVVRDIIELAGREGKRTVRLDVLAGNTAAKHLYTGLGFRYVQSKVMYYEDTGWTEFIMYEFVL